MLEVRDGHASGGEALAGPQRAGGGAGRPGSRLRPRRRRLFAFLAVALAGAAAAALSRPARIWHLSGQLRGCEHEASAPREQLRALLGKEAVPYFTRLLDHPEAGIRLQAMEALLELRGPRAAPELLPLISDSYSRVRERLVEEASRWEGPGARALLLQAAADHDGWVQGAAVTALAHRARRAGDRAPDLLLALAAAAESPDPAVASTAMGAMRALAGRDFGYRARASAAAKEAALGRWRRWWIASRPRGGRPPQPAHITRAGPAPAFAVRDTSGRSWSLAAARGRPVLLHFFGTWCAACLPEMEELERLHREHPELLLLALGVAEEGEEAVRRFARGQGLSYPVAVAPEAMREAYGRIHEVPVTYLIDRQGRTRRRYDGTRDLHTLRRAIADAGG